MLGECLHGYNMGLFHNVKYYMLKGFVSGGLSSGEEVFGIWLKEHVFPLLLWWLFIVSLLVYLFVFGLDDIIIIIIIIVVVVVLVIIVVIIIII